MTKLNFDSGSHFLEYGLDRGVAYSDYGPAEVWVGLTGFDENVSPTSLTYSRDGQTYAAEVEPGDFSAKIKAFTYPKNIRTSLGIPEVSSGLMVDVQKPMPFSMSYRTLVGNGSVDDRFGYLIHLVYNAVGMLGSRSRATTNKDTPMTEFNIDLVCVPVAVDGFRPSAHYVVDTRDSSANRIAQLENILYGSKTVAPYMPHPQVVADILRFGDGVTFVETSPGVFSVSGKTENVVDLGEGRVRIRNVNAAPARSDGVIVITSNLTTIIK